MAENRVIPKGYELWGMPWDAEWTRMDVLFDMHHPDDVTEKIRERDMDVWQPLYMQEGFYSNATRYPIESVIKIVGDYFSCSIAYMLGFAIYHKVETIVITGVTAAENYAEQRPCIEYLIGVLRGQGATVEIIGDTMLFTGKRYGYR